MISNIIKIVLLCFIAGALWSIEGTIKAIEVSLK